MAGTEPEASSRIFISYRREDSSGHVLALLPALRRHFGAERIFKDTDNIPPGVDFLKFIKNELDSCSVLLAIMGREWLTVQDARLKQRRLDNPEDFLRVEVATALKNERIRVIPVLIERAAMPAAADLPSDLADLQFRNAIELSDTRWDTDVQLLIQAIERAAADSVAKPKPVQRPGLAELEKRRSREIGAHLSKAQEAFDAGDFEQTLWACDKALLLDPERADVLELMDRARKAIDEQKIEGWLSEARQAMRQGDIGKASDFIDQALSIDQTSQGALALRTEMLELRRDRERERERARVVQSAIVRAQSSFEEDDFDAALRHADDALAVDAGSADAQEIRSKALAAIEERRRLREHKRRAQQSVTEARSKFAAGEHQAALLLLREFSPAHELTSNALAELESEFRVFEEQQRLAAEAARAEAAQQDELRRAQAEAERAAAERVVAEQRAREERERRQREETERLKKEDAARRMREETERREKEEAQRRQKEEVERLKREEAKRRQREEEERRQKEEEERRLEEAKRRQKEEAQRRQKEETLDNILTKARNEPVDEVAIDLLNEGLAIAPGDSRLQALRGERQTALDRRRAEAREKAAAEAAFRREQERRAGEERARLESKEREERERESREKLAREAEQKAKRRAQRALVYKSGLIWIKGKGGAGAAALVVAVAVVWLTRSPATPTVSQPPTTANGGSGPAANPPPATSSGATAANPPPNAATRGSEPGTSPPRTTTNRGSGTAANPSATAPTRDSGTRTSSPPTTTNRGSGTAANPSPSAPTRGSEPGTSSPPPTTNTGTTANPPPGTATTGGAPGASSPTTTSNRGGTAANPPTNEPSEKPDPPAAPPSSLAVDRAAIQQLLDRYVAAYNDRDEQRLRAVDPSFDRIPRRELIKSVNLTFGQPEIDISPDGQSAKLSVTGNFKYVWNRAGFPPTSAAHLTWNLRKRGTEWTVVPR